MRRVVCYRGPINVGGMVYTVYYGAVAPERNTHDTVTRYGPHYRPARHVAKQVATELRFVWADEVIAVVLDEHLLGYPCWRVTLWPALKGGGVSVGIGRTTWVTESRPTSSSTLARPSLWGFNRYVAHSAAAACVALLPPLPGKQAELVRASLPSVTTLHSPPHRA